ncbi:MAG: LysR family transcriptional regulator [Polyangiales bacterium]
MRATLDELRAVAEVCETAGFTAAARRLGLTTNAVSLRIRSLEVAARGWGRCSTETPTSPCGR